MKRFIVAASLVAGLASGAYAQAPATKVTPPAPKAPAAAAATASDTTCAIGGQKLVGAAKASFMKKCSADATTACTKEATDKKLRGASKASAIKKCVADHIGTVAAATAPAAAKAATPPTAASAPAVKK